MYQWLWKCPGCVRMLLDGKGIVMFVFAPFVFSMCWVGCCIGGCGMRPPALSVGLYESVGLCLVGDTVSCSVS